MNNPTHTEEPVVAYCRTCGRGLTESTKRDVMGVIYCEPCIASRLQGTMPAVETGTAVPPPPPVPVVVAAIPGAPSPGLALLLSILFPFGVGAVYNGQFTKGLVHAGIFAGLIFGISNDAEVLVPFLIFFIIYQVFDAYRTAKAKQLGLPAPPDFFGLNETPGTPGEANGDRAKAPIGAYILIGLGVLFLMSNMGIFRMRWIGEFWPVILIALGGWMLYQRQQQVVKE